ncbi:SDR family oxidoreductase [Deinococcus psychrotolerans]|uniref:SDR family oxidoreductase n=1 Tax=Deinococcus psychrotolerans TaxID=2489213 RepID=A0A3G8YBF5_9DEIO|nr:SDR family oxidoreductase [Deinococcus psychrotolerans]AZI42719.1 SDR family oxidoreductase [Deinococcus psychrotolerans]
MTNPQTQKSAFITGGSKGIGYSTAEALLKEGYGVTITSRDQSEIEAAAQRLNSQQLGESARGVVCDVRDLSSLEGAMKAHAEAFGGLDVLFVNAGVGKFAPIQDMSAEDWQAVIDTNLTGAFFTVKAAIPYLKESHGYVITLSSLAGKNPFAAGGAYNASKFGLNGLSEVMMLDLRPLNIKVTQIMPGSVATHFGGHTPSESDAWKIQPEDIAQIVVDLVKMPARTLPSRVEVRPAQPPRK